MKLKKIVLLFLTLNFQFLTFSLFSQNVGINATGSAPNVAALLDIDAAPGNDKGVLLPRVALTITSSNAPIGASVVNSLLVYNTATINDVTPGYYYWDSTKWVRLLNTGNTGLDWTLTGNSGTNSATNFIGTTDAQDWVIKTNNTEKMRVTSGGNVGIGNSTPGSLLQITTSTSQSLTDGFSSQRLDYFAGGSWNAGVSGAQITFGQPYWSGDPTTSVRVGAIRGVKTMTDGNFGGGLQFLFQRHGAGNMSVGCTLTGLGNVGIGTTTPIVRLHVSALDSEVGRFQTTLKEDTDPTFKNFISGVDQSGDIVWFFGDASLSKRAVLSARGSNNDYNLDFETATTTRMRIDTSGNVGIGTLNPLEKLHIDAGANTWIRMHGTNITGLDLRDGVSASASIALTGGNLRLNSPANGAGSQLVVAPAGVGIGTVSPQHMLHLQGFDTKIHLESTQPGIIYHETDGNPNENWWVDVNGGRMRFMATNDALNTFSEKLSLMQDGKVGIGTTNPLHKVQIVGDMLLGATATVPGYKNLLFQSGNAMGPYNGVFEILPRTIPGTGIAKQATYFKTACCSGAGGSTRHDVLIDGKVGIGTTTPSQQLTVFNGTTTGTYTATGWAHSSDRRLKTNITAIENSLEKIKTLQGVYFNWKNNPNENKQIGFIAQEVEKVLPEVVLKDEAGNYSMVYGNITAVLLNAIKEQQQIIENQQLEIGNQKTAIESLKTVNKNQQITNQQTNLRLKTLESFLQTAKK